MSDKEIDQQELMFIGLVQSFASSAWIQLGKKENPMTGKTEVNLREAQFTIDMLEMIAKKTRGNLSEQEEKLINSSLSDLKRSFVELSKQEKPDSGDKK